MKYFVLPLAVLMLGAPALDAQVRSPVVVRSLVGRGRVLSDTMGKPYQLSYSAKQVFHALIGAYEGLKIPPDLADSLMLAVGNQGFDRRGDVGGRRMFAVLDCGAGPDGDYADANRISMSMITFISPGGPETSTIRSVLLASVATSNARGRNECRTKGDLEERVYKGVLRKLEQ